MLNHDWTADSALSPAMLAAVEHRAREMRSLAVHQALNAVFAAVRRRFGYHPRPAAPCVELGAAHGGGISASCV